MRHKSGYNIFWRWIFDGFMTKLRFDIFRLFWLKLFSTSTDICKQHVFSLCFSLFSKIQLFRPSAVVHRRPSSVVVVVRPSSSVRPSFRPSSVRRRRPSFVRRRPSSSVRSSSSVRPSSSVVVRPSSGAFYFDDTGSARGHGRPRKTTLVRTLGSGDAF